jgi:hypothetical protein
MIDFVTVIPIWLTKFLFPVQITAENIRTFPDFINYVLYGAYTLRILRALRLRKKFMHIVDEVRRTLFNIILSVTVMILFGKLLYYLHNIIASFV